MVALDAGPLALRTLPTLREGSIDTSSWRS
jgi:hypothetical protein